MRKGLRFLKKQNKGSAIVIVIVAMAFVGILGSTLMWMSLVNYRMKSTDRQIKESFYNAETVFEQLIVGLQNVASDSADQAYSFIMQNYANFPEEKRNAEFQKEYLKSIRDAVAKSSTEIDKYDLQKLMVYVDTGEHVGVVTPSAVTGSWIGARDPDTSKAGKPDEYKSQFGVMTAPVNADYIQLKGLHLEYTDEDGFLTMIDTDIMITAPDAGFTQSGKMSDVFDYAIIADKSLEKAGTGNVTVRGNLYAGKNDEGTSLTVKGELLMEQADYVVSQGEVQVLDGGSLTIGRGADVGDAPDIWASDIKIGGTISGGKITLNGHAYVQDDLTMNTDNSQVILNGSYYGYGNSDEKAAESSAIIINGMNNTLDFSKVEHLLLAGHAYTSVKGSMKAVPDPDEKAVEIPTGESIAVKGSQVAYLVPDECIGVLYGKSVYGKNPLTGAEHVALTDYEEDPEYSANFKLVDVNRQVESLGGKSLSSYGITYPGKNIKMVFIPSNGETMVYYYLVFPSQAMAERYFTDYYNIYKQRLDRYVNVYAKGGIKSNDDFTRITVAGNYLTTDETALGGISLKNRTDSVSAGNDLDAEIESYHNTFASLTTNLSTNYLALTSEEKARTVFENIVDTVNFKKWVVEGIGGARNTWKLKVKDAAGNEKVMAVLINKDDQPYPYDASHIPDDPVLVIAIGDIDIQKNVNGIVLAGGKVTIADGIEVTSAKAGGRMSELVQALQATHDSTDPSRTEDMRPLDFIRNADQYVLAGTPLTPDDTAARMQSINFANYVQYQNWSKK